MYLERVRFQKGLLFKTDIKAIIKTFRLCKEQTAKAERNQVGYSINRYKFVTNHFVANVVVETDRFAIGYARMVYATAYKLVYEGAVMIGTHSHPAVIVDFTIE